MTTRDALSRLVDDSLQEAEASLQGLRSEKVAKAMVANLPRFRRLELGWGADAWAAILFVDVRNSTKRARRLGARKTFLSMHALLPALAYCVSDAGGHVIGFRGDGLFAAFGLNDTGHNPEGLEQGAAITQACRAGLMMLEAVVAIVNPALEKKGCDEKLHIGVGIDCDTVILTRIGLASAHEVTAYGDAVNSAAKMSSCGTDQVLLSVRADSLYPTSASGKAKTVSHPTFPDCVTVSYPESLLDRRTRS